MKSKYFLSVLIACFLPISAGFGKEKDVPPVEPRVTDKKPLYLKADEASYDQDADVTTAKGNVEVYHPDGYVLHADSVKYSPTTNHVVAEGRVKLYNDKQDVVFANKLEGSPTFREGTLEAPKFLTSDKRRVAAVSGSKDGDITRLEKGVYTPCSSCKAKQEKPLWQIKAREVIHDEKARDIIYKDAWVEMWGQPVFYLPYLSHPDPGVKRRSGFLGVKFSNSKRLGTLFSPSYYHVISPSSDFTFSPIISSKVNPVLHGIYRQRFRNAEMILDGSITRDKSVRSATDAPVRKKETTRWHSNSSALVDMTDTWRFTGRYYRASDITYLRKFKFENSSFFLPDHMESNAIFEGFYDKNYATVRSYAFQTTQENVSQRSLPYIAPQLNYYFLTDPNENYGYHYYGRVGLLNILRKSGADVQRFASMGGWQVPYYSPYGDHFTFNAQTRFDAYHTEHFKPQGYSESSTFTQGRVFPQASLEWKRPLLNSNLSVPTLVSPIVNVVTGPVMGINKKIPDEDSLGGIELDETSLFSMDRFAGLDELDSGTRVNYGVVAEFYPEKWRSAKAFIGQSYAFTRNKAIPNGQGVNKGYSDIVGVLEAAPSDMINIRYRYQFNQRDYRARRSLVTFALGQPVFKITGDYLYAARNATNQAFNGKEQLRTTVSSNFVKYWTGELSSTRDLGKNGGNLEQSAALTYEDECFKSALRVTKTFFQNREIKPDTVFSLVFTLKTLGEIDTSSLVNRAMNRNRNNTATKKDTKQTTKTNNPHSS